MGIIALGALAGPPISGAINKATDGFVSVGMYAGARPLCFPLILSVRWLTGLFGKRELHHARSWDHDLVAISRTRRLEGQVLIMGWIGSYWLGFSVHFSQVLIIELENYPCLYFFDRLLSHTF